MPCRYDGPTEFKDDVRDVQLKNELDKLTRMLCALCRSVESSATVNIYLDDETHKWWTIHKKMDELRRQELRSRAKSKLSDDELNALGLER